MNLAKLMASTFEHTATIKRSVDAKEGLYDTENLFPIYTNIPCAISGGGSVNQQSDEYQPVQYTDTLYTSPDIEVLAGDIVEADIYGVKETFLAGDGRKYPSHCQTPILRKGRA